METKAPLSFCVVSLIASLQNVQPFLTRSSLSPTATGVTSTYSSFKASIGRMGSPRRAGPGAARKPAANMIAATSGRTRTYENRALPAAAPP